MRRKKLSLLPTRDFTEEVFSGEPIRKCASHLSGSNLSTRLRGRRQSASPSSLPTYALTLGRIAAAVQNIFVLGKITRAAVGKSLRVDGHNNLQSTRLIHQTKYDHVRSFRCAKSSKTKSSDPPPLVPRGRNRARKARRIINRRDGKKSTGVVRSCVSLHREGV